MPGSKARVGVSAGPAWLRSEGEAESLVYTAYTLGGHSVLFSEDHLVSFDFPSSGLGLDVGAFLEADLGPNVGLRLDARYFWGPERDASVTLAGGRECERRGPERRARRDPGGARSRSRLASTLRSRVPP